MNSGGVSRTAPATPGLLNIYISSTNMVKMNSLMLGLIVVTKQSQGLLYIKCYEKFLYFRIYTLNSKSNNCTGNGFFTKKKSSYVLYIEFFFVMSIEELKGIFQKKTSQMPLVHLCLDVSLLYDVSKLSGRWPCSCIHHT